MPRRTTFACLLYALAMIQGSAAPIYTHAAALDGGVGRELPAEATFSDTPYSAREAPSVASSLGPFADPGGIRAFLARHGITYTLDYIGEAFGNATGGVKRGVLYERRLDLQVTADLEPLAGLDRTVLHANG